MLLGERDTIAAIATPAGSGGVGVIRISGPRSAEIVARVLRRSTGAFEDRRLVFGVARDERGERLDEVFAVVMRGPRSYTGEDVAEVQGHGGAVNMARLLRAVLHQGARPAQAGEFTRRAFENGRLDLTRAEAVLDVIAAGSERAWRVAQSQLRGTLGERVGRLRERGTMLLAEVEACIDFPEDDIDNLDHVEAGRRAEELADETSRSADSFVLGRALTEGIEVAIIGPVNSGKSSIFNKLAGSERAVVTAEPGTTRDFVEARVVWEGLPITLVDTAGQRAAFGGMSPAEARGMELGRERAARVDLRVIVHEANRAGLVDTPALDREGRGALGADSGSSRGAEESRQQELHIVTKGDLLPDGFRAALLITSAVTGQGLEELQRAVVSAALGSAAESDEGAVVTSERQRTLLLRAAGGYRRAARAVEDRAPTEMIALELREAVEALAEITGDRVGEEVLDALFSRFCIGK